MGPSTGILLGTAATLGLVHTAVGVDHSLPFIVLGRSQGWPLRKTLWVTALCGLAHVLSSVLIGSVGLALGHAASQLEAVESTRGGWAAQLMIALGLAYGVWGLFRAMRARPHAHPHAHHDGTVHLHEHDHRGAHSHAHVPRAAKTLTVIGLVIVFALGPCEVLIPLLLVPAFEQHWLTAAAVAAVFGGTTIGTMLGIVALGSWGLKWRGVAALERHLHTVAGFTIAASGLAIQLLGL